MLGIVLVVLSIVITRAIGKKVFRNTIGTFSAYAKYYVGIWVVVFILLSQVFKGLFS